MAKDLDLTEFGGAPQLDLNEFNQPAPEPASKARRAADTGLALGRGIIAVPEAAVGVSNIVTGGRTGKAVERLGVRFKDAKQVLTDMQSDEQKAADAQVQEADGFLPTLGAMVRNPSTIVNAAAESAPSMLAGGALSQGLVSRGVGAITAGAAGEGIFSAGSSAEQVRQESPTGFLTPKQAALAATSGAVTGAINRASGKVAEKLGIADVNTTMATGKLGGATDKGVARRIGEGAVNEGVLQELPQSMQEQAMQNLALDKPIGEGVAQAGASGMLVGGLTGGGFGAVSGPAKTPAPSAEDPSVGAPPAPPSAPPAQPGVSPGVLPGVFSSTEAKKPTTPATPPAAPPTTRSQAMGINPAAGPLSAGAAVTVDTGADVITQQQQVEKQKAEAAAKEKAKPGADGKKPEPEAPPPVQPAPADPTAPITGPFTQAIHGASNATPTPAPAVDPQGVAAAPQGAGPAADTGAAPGTGADQGPQGEGPVPAAVPEQVQAVQPVTQQPTQEIQNASPEARSNEVIDQETGEITQPGPQGAGGDGIQRPADALQPGADAKGPQPAPGQPTAPAPASTPPEGKPASTAESVAARARKDRWLKNVADAHRLAGSTGVQIGGVVNGRVNFLGNPNATKQGRALQGSVEEAINAGATPQEIVDAARKPAAPAQPKPPAPTTPVDMGAHTAATSPHNDRPEPTQAQKEAGNAKLGHIVMSGLGLSIENPEGSTRRSKPDSPVKWETTMKDGHYGYVKGSIGMDGDHVDTFIKPGTPLDHAGTVFVIDQIDPATGKPDEHKVMIGYPNGMAARQAYQGNYQKGWKGFKAITPMAWDEFKAWVKSEGTKAPLAAEKSDPSSPAATPPSAPTSAPSPDTTSSAVAPSAPAPAPTQAAAPSKNESVSPAAVGPSPDGKPTDQAAPQPEWFLGKYGKGMKQANAQMKAANLNNTKTDPAITYVAEEHGLPGMQEAWGVIGRKTESKKPVTPQIPNEPGTKYVLPSFASNGAAKGPTVVINKLGKDGLTDAERAAGKAPYSAPPGNEATSETARRAEFALASGTQVKVTEHAERGRFTVMIKDGVDSWASYGSFSMADGGNVSGRKYRANWAESVVDEAANTFSAMQRGETTNVADAPAPTAPRRRQPGDADYTLLDARNDLIEMRTIEQGFGIASDDRLLERIRRQEKLIAEMEGAKSATEPKAEKATDKAEIRPYRKPDGSIGYEAVPIIPPTPVVEPTPKAKPAPSANTIFTEDAAAAARARLKAKLGRLNSGLDPETMLDGITLAGYHIEKGARTFAAYAKAMVEDLGDAVKPYLKSWYMGVRYDPRASGFDGMSSAAEVEAASVDTLDTPDEKAQNAKNGRDDATDSQPAVGQRDPGAVQGADGERGTPAQQPAAPDNSGNLEAPQPTDVPEPAVPPAGDATGVRAPGADVGPGAGSAGPGDAGDGRPGAGRKGKSAAGARGRRAAGPDPAVKAPESVSPANPGPGDFSIDDPLKIVGGGQVARFEKNKAAIELRNRLIDEGRMPTREEQTVLAGYTGWGSFGQELFQGSWTNPAPKAGWEARDKWLRENLGAKEWEGMQTSIINAHYTDPPTVLAMWDMVRRMGFTGGRVLEPSIGIGNFFGMMPADLVGRSQRAGIELDPVTGSMAQMLYPNANIQIKGYEASTTPDNFYDLVIGNWPFFEQGPADRRYNRLSPTLHDYFFLKAIDQTRPGGLVVGITSKGTMDKKGISARIEMARKAELVAAFRLPSGAFEEYAGTKVVTDIIILRKRKAPIGIVAKEGWIETLEHPTREGTPVAINEYFHKNPSHVIGEIDFGHGTTTFRPGLIVRRPANMMEQLRRIVDLVPEGAFLADQTAKHISYVANHTKDRTNSLVDTPQGLFVVHGEHMAPAGEILKYELKDPKATQKRVDELKALVKMRQLYAELIDAERGAAGADTQRAVLRKAYEAFTKANGPMSKSFGLQYLRKLDDPFYPSLAALEIGIPGADGKMTYRPAKILSESTMRGARAIANPSISDAFVLARNESVNPSIARIAEISGKPEAEVRQVLVESGAGFEMPNGDFAPADIYLSGNVRAKLREAKAAVEAGNKAVQRNVEALQQVVPADIPYYKIETQMGATWVPPSTYAEFVGHMLGIQEGIEVGFQSGAWKIDFPSAYNHRAEATSGFGTTHVKFKRLVRAAIANQSITVKMKDQDGVEHVMEDATKEVNAKIADMRLKFGEWLWSDPVRRTALEAEYNEVRNAYADPKFDGSFLGFQGMALTLGRGPFNLREHQVNAIWRGLVTRKSLNAHEVGTGKTFTMGGIAVESRRYGIAKKPMLFAHNANSKSVAHEIQMMYPAAKVLYVDNLSKENLKTRMMQIANDDWDVIVMPHSIIDRIGFKESTLMGMAQEELNDLQVAAEEAASEDGVSISDAMWEDEEELNKLRSVTAKQLVKQRLKILSTIHKLAQQASKEDSVAFEDMGVDMLLVDEAHEFKKPPIATKMKLKGLQTQTSNRSIALMFLTKYVRANNNGANVHLFTGTPITNTMTEVFHMMRYMMQEEMKEVALADWDGWFGSFAREVNDVELTSTGEYEAVTRLQSFINVPELRRMIGQYMDVVFSDDMPEMVPRSVNGKLFSDPTLTEAERAQLLNGRTEGAADRPYKKVVNESSDMSPDQLREFARVQRYANTWKNMSKKDRKDAMTRGAPESPIIHEGIANKASFDVRLVEAIANAGKEGSAEMDPHPDSKAARTIKNLLEIYRGHPQANQVVFMSQGMAKTVTRREGPVGMKRDVTYPAFSTMHDMIERLVAAGVPRDQIAAVDGSTSKDRRKEIADAMNTGQIRIVFGSTGSLGVGVNMQRNLRAMHHMDAPWMPGDLEQRNGRGHRQGNQWNTVLEFRYITDRLDGKRWQTLARKQKFITDFMKSKGDVRVIEGDVANEEEGDILSTFAEAAGDPRILLREKLKKTLEGLQSRERMHGIAQSDAAGTIKAEQRDIESMGRALTAAGPVVKSLSDLIEQQRGDGFTMTVKGKQYTKRSEAVEALDKVAADMRTGDEVAVIGSYGPLQLYAQWYRFADAPFMGVSIPGSKLDVNANGMSLASLESSLRHRRDNEIPQLEAQIARAKERMEHARKVLAEPFHMADKLAKTRKQLEDMERDIEANPVAPPYWLRNGAPIDTEVYRGGKPFTVTGHRWSDQGWFVVGSDEKGEVNIPYMQAKDAQGMPLYEEHEFSAPTLANQPGWYFVTNDKGVREPAPRKLSANDIKDLLSHNHKIERAAPPADVPTQADPEIVEIASKPAATSEPGMYRRLEAGGRHRGQMGFNTPDSRFSRKWSGQPFYSALSKELAAVNAGAQPALGWASTINGLVKAGKVKQDEVNWSGVLDWLKLQQGKITREQVVQFLDANGVRVEETVLAGPGFFKDVDEAIDYVAERYAMTPEEVREEYGYSDEQDYIELAKSVVDDKPDATKYGGYQLPGGSNYREILLTLPAKTDGPLDLVWRQNADGKWAWFSNGKQVSGAFRSEGDREAARGSISTVASPAGVFKSNHWDQPNVLAHIRVNDRTDADGKRVLFVEEIQSDWGQEGKRKGFSSAANPMKVWKIIDANGDGIGSGQGTSEAAAIADWRRVAGNRANLAVRAEVQPDSRMEMRGTPAAPFVTKTDAWLSLALKRIVKMAVDEGYDRVAFVNGEQSAERYDLSKRVEEIRHLRQQDGTYDLAIKQEGSRPMVTMNGRSLSGLKESDLEELVGKEIAKKIVAQEGPRGGDGFHKLSGLDLKVGGEGMKAFYDKIVPNTLKDVLRKVGGGALEVVDMGGPDRERRHALIRERRTLSMDDPRRAQLDGEIDLLGRIESGVMAQMKQPGFTVTPAMKERAAGGLPLFDRSTAAVGGIPAQKVRLMAAPIAKRLHIDLRVVDTPAGLPIAAPSDAVGLYHNGTIWVVASNVNTRQDIMQAIAHEAVAHLGLRQLLEPAEYRQLMSMINAGAAAGGKLAEIRASIRKTYVDQNGRFNLSPMAEADEIAARVAELGVDADGNFRPGFEWLKAIFAKVAQWLRSKGLDIPFTNAELQGMLVRAQTHLERGPEAAGQVGAAFARRSDRADVRRMNENQVEREIRLLMPRVERAYESGDLALAERLDARLETLMDAMETNLLEMQEDTLDKAYDGFNRAVLEKEGQEGDIEADLVIDLANRWIEITKPGSWEAKEYPTDVERAAHLRELLGEYAYRHGGLKDNLSDEMIIEAAKDAAASVYAMRKARQDRARAKALTEYRPDDMTPEQRDAVLASMERAGEAKFADQRAQREAASRFSGEQTPIPEWMRATQFMRRESPEFKAWFGDSKVVDAEGKPMIVYHGSNLEDPYTRPKPEGVSEFTFVAHFGTLQQATERAGDGGAVYPVYLNIRNPKRVRDIPVSSKGDTDRWWRVAQNAIDEGYDGLVYKNKAEGPGDSYVTFESAQVKSAIGNSGTFDPANPDIRFSRKPTAAEAIKLAGERTGNTAAHYRGLGLQALGRRQITELYGNILPQLPIYSKLMAQMDADKNEAGAEADQIAQDWGKLKDERQLAELMHDATLAQMDPERPLMRGDDPFTYDRLRAQFVALSPEARKVYVEARDTYRTHHENVRKAIRDRIERSELRGQRKAELLAQMDSEFYQSIKGVYFPLARFGDYVVIVRDPTGKTLSVNRAETINEAQALQESLRQAYPGMVVGKVLKSKEFNAGRDAVGRGFMQSLYEALGRADMDDMQRAELEDMLGQLYLSALPDLSWAKHGIHRKGTPGFSQDARRAFAQNTFHGARYLAKVRYSDLLENELIDAQKQVDALSESDSFDSVKAQQVIDEMVKRHDAAMNPDSNALSTALTSLGFVFHLGLSPASAMVNLTQTALVAFPQMGAKWGFAKASAALLKASQQAAANRNDISTVLSQEERRAYDEAVRSGVIDVTMAHDLAGISQGEDAKVSWKLRPVMRWASFLFHHAEKFNRQVTFVAAYRLAREAGSMPVQAYEQAVKATYDGHFDYSASNRPRIMQGNAARVILLFKQYAQNMVYTLTRQAYLSMKGKNPYERAQARKALGGLLAMHGAAAGVLGLPMVTTLLAAASFLGGDDDEPWDAEVALRNMLADALGDQAADVLARGLSRLTPWDISGRVGLDKLILPDIQEGLEGQDLANSAMAAALGPVAGIGISLIKGMQEISDGHWLRGLEAMAPSLARGPLKALRYGTEGAIDRTGKPIVEEVGAAGVVGQALGFSPSEVRLATEAKSAVHQADQRLNKRRALLLRHYSMAVIMGDEEGAADARQEILAFNEKNPQRRINPLQMARSVATRKKQIAMSQGGVYLPRSHKDAMQAGQFGME